MDIFFHNLTQSHYLSLSTGTFNDEETEETAESQDSAESEAPEFYASDDE